MDTPTLLNWPAHWDAPYGNNPSCVTAPDAYKLFRARLGVMLQIYRNVLTTFGFPNEYDWSGRIMASRSARVAATNEAARLADEELTKKFAARGKQALLINAGAINFTCVEIPENERFEGWVPYRYGLDGKFLHISRDIAALGVGLASLDYTIVSILNEAL